MTLLPSGARCLTPEEMSAYQASQLRPRTSEEVRKQFEADRIGQMALTPEGLVSVEDLPYARTFRQRNNRPQSGQEA